MSDETAASKIPSPHHYVLDNARDEAEVRMVALADMFDPGSCAVLARLGVGPGWRCLEVGAGGPALPLWLAGQVGPSGSVLATDLNPRFLTSINRANVEVRQHDITTDALPAQSFDLVHSRLVLQHVGAQEKALQQMVSALKPGGWLVVEDFGSERLGRDPDFPQAEVLEKVGAAYSPARAAGVRLLSVHRLLQLFHERGLAAVGAEGRVVLGVGGGAGGRLSQANFRQRRADPTLDAAVSQSEFDQAMALLDDPATVELFPVMWAVRGQRPLT